MQLWQPSSKPSQVHPTDSYASMVLRLLAWSLLLPDLHALCQVGALGPAGAGGLWRHALQPLSPVCGERRALGAVVVVVVVVGLRTVSALLCSAFCMTMTPRLLPPLPCASCHTTSSWLYFHTLACPLDTPTDTPPHHLPCAASRALLLCVYLSTHPGHHHLDRAAAGFWQHRLCRVLCLLLHRDV